MGKRREAKPVTLTPEQRERLEDLWFVYGNHGRLTTPGNHTFIQTILEHGLDLRPLITKRTRKSEIPTKECEDAVDKILKHEDGAAEPTTRHRLLRLLQAPKETRPRLQLDQEVIEMLDAMKRRQGERTGAPDAHGETPDAA